MKLKTEADRICPNLCRLGCLWGLGYQLTTAFLECLHMTFPQTVHS